MVPGGKKSKDARTQRTQALIMQFKDGAGMRRARWGCAGAVSDALSLIDIL